ncbi:MAG: hypothetical protein RL368_1958 [Pseudomonadota bacterium]|jgi:hypothetical protein
MRDMILITPCDFKLEKIKLLLSSDPSLVVNIDASRLGIGSLSTNEFIQIEYDESLSVHYEDDEGDVFKPHINEPSYYLINFKNIDFMKMIILKALNMPDIYLDNDLGLILQGTLFADLIKEKPNWDWALEINEAK